MDQLTSEGIHVHFFVLQHRFPVHAFGLVFDLVPIGVFLDLFRVAPQGSFDSIGIFFVGCDLLFRYNAVKTNQSFPVRETRSPVVTAVFVLFAVVQ